MHENFKSPLTGKNGSSPESKSTAFSESVASNRTTNGASFDDSYSFCNMRKLQDASKFDKARFSFRLYKR